MKNFPVYRVKNKLRSLASPILGMWHRRRSLYVNTGKVALCCIAKMENEYIRFFVEYYNNLHFDKIFIYDNNDPDGERIEDAISNYIKSGLVEIVDFRGRKVAQLAAYQDCYDKQNKEYDWIAFFDCDEFLTFTNGIEDIHVFLENKRFFPFQAIHINWMVYGDNELLDNDGRNVIERFISPIPYDTKGRYGTHLENSHVKSIIRGGLSNIVWSSTPHTPISKYYHCCTPEGKQVDLNSPFMQIDYDMLFLRHYSTKTIGEWVRNKMQRGIPDRPKDSWESLLNLDCFFYYNTPTKEKREYAEKMMKELEEECKKY